MSGGPNIFKVSCEGVERIRVKRELPLTGLSPFWRGTIEDLEHPDNRAPEPRDPPCLQCHLYKTFPPLKVESRSSWPAQEGFSSSTHHNSHGIAWAFGGQQILQGHLTHWAHTCENKESSRITKSALEDGGRGSSEILMIGTVLFPDYHCFSSSVFDWPPHLWLVLVLGWSLGPATLPWGRSLCSHIWGNTEFFCLLPFSSTVFKLIPSPSNHEPHPSPTLSRPTTLETHHSSCLKGDQD